jgi:tetratricopeptide (TPR) repeat protein
MEHRTKRDAALVSLVSDFEANFEKGKVEFLHEKTINQLLQFYEVDGQIEKALEVVNIGLEQYKYRSDFYIIKARLLLVNKQIDESLSVLDFVQNIAPFEAEIPILRAKALALLGQFTEATYILKEVKENALSGDLVEVFLCESFVYELMKDYDAMYQILVEAVEIDSLNQEVLQRLWISVDLSRKYEESIELHHKLLNKNPYSFLAWYNLGHAYACVQEYEKSIDAMEYSFIINPEFENGYIDCADLCFSIKSFSRALNIYQDAVEVFGPDSELLVYMSECLILLNKIEEAKEKLFLAIKYDAYNDEAYYHLAQCYYKEGNWYSSINAFHKAISLEDRTENYYLGLAKAYIEVEDYTKATINFKKATQAGHEGYIYWYEYASFLLKMGLYKEALMVLDDAEEYTYAAELLYCRAMAHFFIKEREQGLEYLEEALLENYSIHQIIFEIAPELEVNSEIQSMLKYFKYES